MENNQCTSMSANNLDDISNRIRRLTADVQNGIVAIGFELIAAKNQVGYGNWAKWLQKEFKWTQQQANRFMRVARRFGKLNINVQFKSTTLFNMLALPEGDETSFIKAQAEIGKPVESQSTEELKAAVKEWNNVTGKAKNNSIVDELNQEPKETVTTKNSKPSVGTNNYYTPLEYVDAAREVFGGVIDLDPSSCETANAIVKAKKFYTVEDDGLAQSWFGHIWLNPPYSKGDIDAFAAKLINEISKGNVEEAITLTDNKTDTKWFSLLVEHCDGIVFKSGRINFMQSDGVIYDGTPRVGQVFIYFGNNPDKFFQVFAKFGWGCRTVKSLKKEISRYDGGNLKL